MTFRQPYLHDLAGVVAAPIQAWSDHHGQIRGDGAQGAYCGDDRVLARAVLRVDGAEPEWISTQEYTAGETEFIYIVRVPAPVADPLVSVTRLRTASAGRLAESLTFKSIRTDPVRLSIELELVADSTPLAQVKAGGATAAGSLAPGGSQWQWRGTGTSARLTAEGAALEFNGSQILLRWEIELKPSDAVVLDWSLDLRNEGFPVAAAGGQPLRTPSVSGDPRLTRLMSRSISDLNGLRIAERASSPNSFLAAGAPWSLALSGRDALVAARMLLLIDPQLAAGTLRALGARQGTHSAADSGEQPGKILREVRRVTYETRDDGEIRQVPPVSYDSIDATCLWVILLHDAWHSGMSDAQVQQLLPNLQDALAWLREYGDSDGDGFLEPADPSGTGTWKDSADAVRFHDGRVARGPVALAEVQAYAYEAAIVGAEMLDHFGLPGSGEWRAFAADLAARFREKFWCEDDAGAYPALALDRDKRPVDGIGSGMGHLLGTGLLHPEEKSLVVKRLMGQSLFTGYGVRTISDTNGGYWPTRHHAGSVWTHDTAWIIMNLMRDGFDDQAARLARGLLDAAEGFGWRLPEHFSGHDSSRMWPPVPYPTACRPQAWAAASAVPVAQALGGFNVLG
jgi:glycogen debranching enzyme